MAIQLKGRRVFLQPDGAGKLKGPYNPPLQLPAAPVLSVAVLSNSALRLSLISGEHVRVDVSDTGTGNWTQLVPAPMQDEVDHTGLPDSTTRYYRPTAKNSVGETVGAIVSGTTKTSTVVGDTPSSGTGTITVTPLETGTDDGELVRLTADSTLSFGTKPEGPAQLHDFVHTSYERGVANTYHAMYPDGDIPQDPVEENRIYMQYKGLALESDPSLLRHPGAKRMFRGAGGKISPRVPYDYRKNGWRAGHRTMYLGAKVRYKEDSRLMRALSDEFSVGTFIEGEELNTNNGEFIGRYSYFSPTGFANLKHHCVIDNDLGRQPSKSELAGKRMVGVESGAYLDFPNHTGTWGTDPYNVVNGTQYDYPRTRGPKLGRIWDNDDGHVTGQVRCSYAVHDGYIGIVGGSRVVNHGGDTVQVPGKWHTFEIEMDLHNGYFRQVLDNKVIHETTFTGPVGDPAFSPTMNQFGIDGGWTGRQLTDIDEIYFDYSRNRIYVGNAATYTACTEKEFQRIETWLDKDIDIRLNYGVIPAGQRWLYVVDSAGQVVNADGVPI